MELNIHSPLYKHVFLLCVDNIHFLLTLKCFRSCDAQLRTSRTPCTATLSVRSTLDPSYFRTWYTIWKTWFSSVRLVKNGCIISYISTVTGNMKLLCRCILSHKVKWLLYKSHSCILSTIISCPLYLITLRIDSVLWWTWVGRLIVYWLRNSNYCICQLEISMFGWLWVMLSRICALFPKLSVPIIEINFFFLRRYNFREVFAFSTSVFHLVRSLMQS